MNLKLFLVAGFLLLPAAGEAQTNATSGNVTAETAKPPSKKKADSKQPIQITSDKLEVLQTDQKAIFTGKVIAVQGETTMTADKMIVYYRNQNQPRKGTDKTNSSAAGSSVSKIDVAGNVHVTNPSENATGDTGSYDVDKKEITLNDHVILHRDQNVLKGDHLTYNVDTGRSVLNEGGTATALKDQNVTNGRVQGVFYPSDKETNATAGAAKTNATVADPAKTNAGTLDDVAKAGLAAELTKTNATAGSEPVVIPLAPAAKGTP